VKSRLVGVALIASAVVAVGPVSASGEGGLQVPDGALSDITAAKSATYIVFMEAEPAVAYEGDEAGLASTAPAEGEALSREDTDVQAYVGRLEAEHDQVLASVGAPPAAKLATYTYAANGFAVELTGAQAGALRSRPGVTFVVPDQIRTIQTDASPEFLGLTSRRGPWASGLTGEDVVVGVIDTGIWPEHPSFADDGSYRPLAPTEFSGTGCDFGNSTFNAADAAFTCTNKLLAAKSYGTVFHGGIGTGLAAGSYLSARDEDGHGTHTASTAAGNAGVSATLLGADRGVVSGIAPRARISMYKACWVTAPGEGGCSNGDLVDAIDDAVADGVDVINYSIGSDTAALSPDSIGFLFANDAGVFVAASAGNAGPGAGTVGAPAVSPWLTSVGASTQRRDFRGTVTLGDGQTFEGVTVTAGIASVPIVDAATLGNPLCAPTPGFPAGSITGAMVLCERGGNARVEKSLVVQQGGGVAMLLYNPTLNSLNTDNHYLPSLHVDATAGAAARAYIAAAGAAATASLSGGQKVDAQANVMASFSSRGPNLLSEDIITPDVTAPGVNILAGNTPTALLGSPGELFQAISGTSMSSPHVAGIYALVKQAHPEWSAAAAKSALMTSARQDMVKEDGVTRADPFDMGAGHVKPGGNVRKKGSLFNPGLVYDAGLNEYAGFLCEAAPDSISPSLCAQLAAAGIPTTAENLNIASIGVSDVTGTATVTRTITNVTNRRIEWEAEVRAPRGFRVRVRPDEVRLRPGQSATVRITVTRTTAAFDTWSFGSLTWEGSDFKVRSPIALRAKELAFPAAVSGTGTAGTVDIPVTFGYAGAYTANAHGLVAANRTPGTVVDDPANDINTALATGVGITLHDVDVPAGTALARISLFDTNVDGADDLDLYVFGPDGSFAGGSGSGTSQEQVDLLLPAAGVYTVVVHGWQTDGPDSNYTLFDWEVPVDDPGGSLTIQSAPSAATVGAAGVVTAAWTGLTPGERYLGAVSHTGPNGLLGLTKVTVVG
jgi:subtilisin family serine protease